ncbi:MAG: hypothetical protein EOO73_08080 [Myxococcales bacterium]|nr:MAG: hypothetical protein EOO73_08080 [Myxococcales bacterium]
MSKVLCLTHRGVRCCVPAERVLTAEQARRYEEAVQLWEGDEPAASAPALGERSLRLETADGPRWLWGSSVRAVSITASQIQKLTPVLRELLTLPHVVGLAALGEELVWLVEPLRFSGERAGAN